MYRSHVLVCGGTGCTSSGSQQIIETLKAELEKNGLSNEESPFSVSYTHLTLTTTCTV